MIRALQGRNESAGEPAGSPRARRLSWLQQAATVVYFIAGVFLIYQYTRRLHRQVVLITGILFVLYSVYRFFLVRRSARRK